MTRKEYAQHTVQISGSNNPVKQISVNAYNLNAHKQQGIFGFDSVIKTLSTDAFVFSDSLQEIAAETGVTDNLATITATDAQVNDLAILFADVGDTITVKHGTGNISLGSGVDKVLSETIPLFLMYRGTTWYEFIGDVFLEKAQALKNKTIDADLNTITNIENADIKATAAIAYSKLATLASANILVGSAGGVATSVAMSGDITISNTGVTAIGASKVTDAMLAGSITPSKITDTAAILGANTFTTHQTISLAGSPSYRLYKSDGGVDAKYWFIEASTNILNFSAVADNLGSGTALMKLTRNGINGVSLTLTGTDLSVQTSKKILLDGESGNDYFTSPSDGIINIYNSGTLAHNFSFGSLGTTAGNTQDMFYSLVTGANTSYLYARAKRISNGSDWTTGVLQLYRRVDSDIHGMIQFGDTGGLHDILLYDDATLISRFNSVLITSSVPHVHNVGVRSKMDEEVWSLDTAQDGTEIAIATGATTQLSTNNFSGLFIVNSISTGKISIWLQGGGTLSLVAQIGTEFVNSSTPAATETGVYLSVNNILMKNGFATTQSYRLMYLRTRNAT